MKNLNVEKTRKLLSRIMEFELAGVVRYTHYSLMVSGPNRIPIVTFMKGQATESLMHAQQAGEILTGLGGHPTQQISDIDETYRHTVKDILEESLAHEQRALKLYHELLDVVNNRSVYLEEYARTQIAQEELHGLELRKMLRDIGVVARPEDDARRLAAIRQEARVRDDDDDDEDGFEDDGHVHDDHHHDHDHDHDHVHDHDHDHDHDHGHGDDEPVLEKKSKKKAKKKAKKKGKKKARKA